MEGKMTVYVGVDWGKASSTYAFGTDRDSLKTRTVPNNAAGLSGICERLQKLASDSPVVVAIEAGAPAVTAWLVGAGFAVHVVDGKQARRFVESMASGRSKNDTMDAGYAWWMAQSPMHLDEPVALVSGADRALGLAVRARDQVSKRITRCINQLRALLSELVPDLECQCAKLSSQYVRCLIRLVPTPWHAARITDDDWSRYLAGNCVPKCKRGPLREAIAGDARRPGFAEFESAAVADTVNLLVDELDHLYATDRKFDRAIGALVDASEEATVLKTMGGVGIRVSSRLASTVFSNEHRARADRSADPRDYPTRLARCAPVQNQTGTSVNTVHRRRAGNSVAASATMHAAAQASLHLPWAKAMLQYRRSRGDGYYTALRKLGRSLLRIFGAMLRTGTPYDDARYVAQLKAKGVTWAQTL
jgi:transposase